MRQARKRYNHHALLKKSGEINQVNCLVNWAITFQPKMCSVFVSTHQKSIVYIILDKQFNISLQVVLMTSTKISSKYNERNYSVYLWLIIQYRSHISVEQRVPCIEPNGEVVMFGPKATSATQFTLNRYAPETNVPIFHLSFPSIFIPMITLPADRSRTI